MTFPFKNVQSLPVMQSANPARAAGVSGIVWWSILVALSTTLVRAQPASSPRDYRIAPRDLVQFQIFEEPDTTVVQRVSATGELPLPMIGVVKVEGLTLREAEGKLHDLYIKGGFFVNPQVILVLQQYNERSVSVLGQVNKPEQIQFPLESSSMSIVHAITLAGGLSRLALGDAVQVARVDADGREQRFTVNVEAYLGGGRVKDGSTQFQLLPGDIVFVPERNF